MNVGGAYVTITMIIAGLVRSGILTAVASDGVATELKPNTEIMVQFIIPISVFAGVLVIGVIAGGIAFITNYLGAKNCVNRIDIIRRAY
jgi:hypothetical protein